VHRRKGGVVKEEKGLRVESSTHEEDKGADANDEANHDRHEHGKPQRGIACEVAHAFQRIHIAGLTTTTTTSMKSGRWRGWQS
jgi:hypothetical protein